EERLAAAVIVGLQAQQPGDGGARPRRAVERDDAVEVLPEVPLGLAVGGAHDRAALDAGLARDGLLLADPVARVLVGPADPYRALRARGLRRDAPLGGERERGEEAEDDQQAAKRCTDGPPILRTISAGHGARTGIRRVATQLDGPFSGIRTSSIAPDL